MRPVAAARSEHHEAVGIRIVAVRDDAIALERHVAALHVLVECTLLRRDAALDALAHELGLDLDVERAPACCRGILALDLPRALCLRARRRAIGEEDAAVGGALEQDLRRRRRFGQSDDRAARQSNDGEKGDGPHGDSSSDCRLCDDVTTVPPLELACIAGMRFPALVTLGGSTTHPRPP